LAPPEFFSVAFAQVVPLADSTAFNDAPIGRSQLKAMPKNVVDTLPAKTGQLPFSVVFPKRF
jgi:hypothetical protein